MEETNVKSETTEDDYNTYVYEGASEAPVFELIPLQNIPPNVLAGSDVKIKQKTFKKLNNIGGINNCFLNMGELEKHYAFLKKLRPDCQKDVPSMSSCVPNTRNGSLLQDKATQCTDDYVKSLDFKAVKDASTATGTMFEGFYYKNYLGMCACNKLVKNPSEMETVQSHGSEFLMNFSPSKGAYTEN